MARELGPQGIRVNAINPGVIMTGMNRGVFSQEQQDAMLATIPLGRFGTELRQSHDSAPRPRLRRRGQQCRQER
jgi:NAD(P)-dependent dehydrogenase (short-subunit alcohol dehydrogenase family)